MWFPDSTNTVAIKRYSSFNAIMYIYVCPKCNQLLKRLTCNIYIDIEQIHLIVWNEFKRFNGTNEQQLTAIAIHVSGSFEFINTKVPSNYLIKQVLTIELVKLLYLTFGRWQFTSQYGVCNIYIDRVFILFR